MKKCLIAMFCLAFSSFALVASASGVNEKVLKSFKATFPGAENVIWQALPEKYIAQFLQNGVRAIVDYDEDGNIIESTRYYTEENLPIEIIYKLKKKYPGKKIYGVTEISAGDLVDYYVKLEDDVLWTTVKSDIDGNFEVVEKYRKQ